MPSLRIVIPGDPVPQNVGKVGRWKSKDGREGTVIRQPAKVVRYKIELEERMKDAARGRSLPIFGHGVPVRVHVFAIFSLPEGQHRKTRPVPRRWHVGRYGNCDNLFKAIGDAGEGVLWLDDGQIACQSVEKIVAAQGESPRVEITVEELAPIAPNLFAAAVSAEPLL